MALPRDMDEYYRDSKGKVQKGKRERIGAGFDMQDVQKAYYNSKACETYINTLVAIMNERLDLLSAALKQDNITDIEFQKSMLETIRKRLIYAEYLSMGAE